MANHAATTHQTPTDLAWRVLGLVNLYRLLIPPALIAVRAGVGAASPIGSADPRLFLWVCIVYFAAAIAIVLVGRRVFHSLRTTTLVHAVLDATAIGLLLYASGGVASGLGILFVVPVGAMALLADSRDAFLLAALATVALLLQQIASHVIGIAEINDYPATGILGAIIFLVALLVWPITTRLRESEAIVRRQEVDLANMAQLSQYIVQHLRESILVVDPEGRIRLINESAAHLLGDRKAYPDALLGEASPQLLYHLETWRQTGAGASVAGPSTDPPAMLAADGGHMIRPHFAPLGSTEPAPIIIFLEDTSALEAKVQQSKLASLGRLSASIAHEIRNPVGAMSHAAQLLAESAHLPSEDRRLTEIIRVNGERVRQIIDNVLSMSRRESAQHTDFELRGWLEQFREEFAATMQVASEKLEMAGPQFAVRVRADPSQLRQVVWNLCENSLKYGVQLGQEPRVELRFGRLQKSGRPFLEVADRGPGIPEQHHERIFEPFFTAGGRGTGLGLFVARELAQSNRALLAYEPRAGGGSVFRVVFADPERWEA
ncbi:MAG TPA: ATP-binding protein [Steroidobacteraceae bacterium]|nr:ATP-binding protein [Steroidobacteraceae bacterium]HRX89486.1 ATP-binding protein [Steroidobacteraceae bacterium]